MNGEIERTANLLVVDDDPDVLFATSFLLRKAGYQVMEAGTGEEGLRLAAEHKPDLILLDVRLPDLDGIEVCRRIKANRELADTFVVFLSALKTISEEQTEGLLSGGDGYIARPIGDREFLARVQTMLRLQQAECLLRQKTEDMTWQITEHKKTENALKESEARFRRLAENAPDIIYRFRLKPDAGFEYINPAATAITGYTPEEHYADPGLGFKMVHPDDRGVLQQASGATEIQSFAIRWVRKDGKIIWTEHRVTPVHGPDGEIVALEGIARDVTDQKQAEEALRQNQRRLEDILNHTPAIVCIKDLEGRYVFINCRSEQVLGLKNEEVEGKTSHEIVDSALADQFAANDRRVLETKQPQEVEETIIWNDEEHTFLSIQFPLLDDRSEPYAICSISTDITERKRIETDLYQSEAKYRQLIETMNEGVWVIDEQARTTLVNPRLAEMFGYTEAEMIGRRLFSFMDEEDVEACNANLERRRQGIREQHDFKFRRKDGSALYAALETAPFIDAAGNYTGAIATVMDITERKLAEEALADLNASLESQVEERTAELQQRAVELELALKDLRDAQDRLVRSERLAAIGELAASVAHEVRNPLSAIQASAFYLNRKLPVDSDERIHGSLQQIEKQVIYAEGIIRELLDLTRLGPPERQPVDLNQAVRSALSSMPAPDGVAVNEQLAGDLPQISVDPLQIERAFLNLMINAFQAMPDGGQLTIQTRLENHHIAVRFIDVGSGISPDDQRRIFEPLFTTKAQGVGLGLAICQRIVEAHGGRIEVESQMGKGSTFTVWLPV